MKIRLELEIDMQTGIYDVRFHNLSNPGEDINIAKLSKVVGRVLDNVAQKSVEVAAPALPFNKASSAN